MFDDLEKQKDAWGFVWLSYAGIFGPLALYAFHNDIDARWRRRHPSALWVLAYALASTAFIPAFIVYFSAQVSGSDHKEAATALVAMAVTVFTVRKIIRSFMALEATAVLAQRFALARPPEPLIGELHSLNFVEDQLSTGGTPDYPQAVSGNPSASQPRTGQGFSCSTMLRAAWRFATRLMRPQPVLAHSEYVGDLVEMNAACLFDDAVPGDGAQVAWVCLIWAMLWRFLWHSFGLHKLWGASRRFQNVSVLQDANDLIVMIVTWVWGCLSQVRAPLPPLSPPRLPRREMLYRQL